MTIYFSAATCSFYNTDVYPENNLPEDCVIVEEETYKSLMAQQNAGYIIVAGSDGYPSVMSQSCGSCHCTVHEKTVATADQLGHVKVDGTNIAVNESGEITLPVLEGYVDKTSAQTITGIKTFSSSPLVPTPADDAEGQEAVNAAWCKENAGGGKDLNTGEKIYDWIGTIQEYEDQQIETLHPEYLCYITDDETPLVLAKRDLSNLDETGQAVIDGKIDRDGNSTVIETYHNGTEWYRIWSDGWIEQGGRVYISASTALTVNLLKPYASTDYMISFSHSAAGTGEQAESYAVHNTDRIVIGNACGNAQYFTWKAEGQGA